MDPKIWVNLPDDVALHVIGFLEDLDVRRAFGFKPRRLSINRNFNFRSEYVYVKDTQTMIDFSGMKDDVDPYWIIRRGIPFSCFRTPDVHIFNMGWMDYDMTLISNTHQLGPTKCSNHVVLRDRIKFI